MILCANCGSPDLREVVVERDDAERIELCCIDCGLHMPFDPEPEAKQSAEHLAWAERQLRRQP